MSQGIQIVEQKSDGVFTIPEQKAQFGLSENCSLFSTAWKMRWRVRLPLVAWTLLLCLSFCASGDFATAQYSVRKS